MNHSEFARGNTVTVSKVAAIGLGEPSLAIAA